MDKFLCELTELTKKHGLVIEWTVYGLMIGRSTDSFEGYVGGATFEWNVELQRYETK